MKTNCNAQQRIRFILRLPVFVGLFLLSFLAEAGTGTGKITGVLPYAKSTGERFFFITVEQKNGSPSCNSTNRFVLSDSYAAFDLNVSAVLAAYHGKTQVKIKGLGNCNYWANSESANQICFGNIAC